MFFLILILSFSSLSSTGVPYVPDTGNDFLIDGWDKLPFKSQAGVESWSSFVNSNYDPSEGDWDDDFSDSTSTSFKCLSYAASTSNDWFRIQSGDILPSYKSFINGGTEYGTNPREIEAVYHSKTNYPFPIGNYYYVPSYYDWLLNSYCLLEGSGKVNCDQDYNLDIDPVTQEKVPYNLEGFAEIMSSPPTDWQNEDDPHLLNTPSNLKHTIYDNEYVTGKYVRIPISSERNSIDENNLINALENYGVLYAFTEPPNQNYNQHSMAMVGYGESGGEKYFIFHDNYGNHTDSGEDSRYKKLTIDDISIVYAFEGIISWEGFQHDNRRTGFSPGKGDITSGDKALIWELNNSIGGSIVQAPVISETDGNEGKGMEVFVAMGSAGQVRAYDGDNR